MFDEPLSPEDLGEVLRDPAGWKAKDGPVVTVGCYDGVHRGHQELINRARELARICDGEVLVLTFAPHPARFFNPDLAPPLITTEDQKLRLLEACGLDAVVVETFDESFSSITAEAFVREILIDRLRAKHVLVGHGFRFGSQKGGGIKTLTAMGGGVYTGTVDLSLPGQWSIRVLAIQIANPC